jgi:HK97 family phage portal protein
MNARGLLAAAVRPLAALVRAAEGAYRPGPYYLPVTGGWLSADVGQYWNWWQKGYLPEGSSGASAIVEACVSAYAQTIAMCPGDHWKQNDKGGRDRIDTSALSRILRKPNAYQSISDFLLMAVRWLYLEGNAYALALRNSRNEVSELHLFNSRMCRPQVIRDPNGPDFGPVEIFYRLSGNQALNPMLGQQLIVPARDVLHLRLTPNEARYPYPLIGEPPLLAAMQDQAIYDTIMGQQLNFYGNQARPSAVLSTDLVMDKDQVQALRDRWDEQTAQLGQGKTPILTAGLKVQPWGMPAKDAQLAEILKMSEEHVALAYRVPLQVLGMGEMSFRTAEAMMQYWIATGLGFALNHVESGIGAFFGLKGLPEEYVEFDTSVLLRSQMKDRIDALAKGVTGGIFTVNEARGQEGLDRKAYGDEPRLQAQVVPLSAAAAIPTSPASPASPAAKPEPPKPPATSNDNAPKVTSNDYQRAARDVVRRAGVINTGRRTAH